MVGMDYTELQFKPKIIIIVLYKTDKWKQVSYS